MEKLRVRSKSSATYICNVCECRVTQLRRETGSWPTPEFTALSEDEQNTFYAAAHACANAKQLMSALNQAVNKYEVEEEVYAENGEFLPLTVWGQRGYNTEDRFRVKKKQPLFLWVNQNRK